MLSTKAETVDISYRLAGVEEMFVMTVADPKDPLLLIAGTAQVRASASCGFGMTSPPATSPHYARLRRDTAFNCLLQVQDHKYPQEAEGEREAEVRWRQQYYWRWLGAEGSIELAHQHGTKDLNDTAPTIHLGLRGPERLFRAAPYAAKIGQSTRAD